MKGCKVVSTKRGSRCMCNGKFAKSDRCKSPSAKSKRGR